MNNKYFIGSRVQNLDILNETNPITEVVLWIDDDTCVVAGSNDGTGYTLEANCPSATQAMANAILASVLNKQFQGLEGANAVIDMDAELGDGITVAGYYTILGSEDIVFGTDMWDVSAPINSELEEEYPYITSLERSVRREVSKAMASLSVLSDAIIAEVRDRENADSGLASRIEQTLSSISFSVTNGSTSSTITMSATKEDGSTITIGSQNITFSGVVTFTDLSTAGSTTINGSNITTGTISAARLDSSVITSTDLSTAGSTTINGANITTGTISAARLDLSGVATFSDISDAIDDLEDDLYYGTTVINGGCITTGVIDAQYIATDISQVNDELYIGDSTTTGYIYLYGSGSSSSAYGWISASRSFMSIAANRPMYIESTDYIVMECGNSLEIEMANGRYWQFDNTGIYYVASDGTKLLKVNTTSL